MLINYLPITPLNCKVFSTLTSFCTFSEEEPLGFSSFKEEKIEVVIFGWDFVFILNDTLSALSKFVQKNSTLNSGSLERCISSFV